MSDVADDQNSFVQQVTRLLNQLSLAQKIGIAFSAVAVAALIYGTVQLAGGEHHEILFGGLEPADATEIAARLREEGVPYRLAPGGRSVEVPASRVDELRLLLAGDGLPRGGGMGYELFDTTSFGVSDFVQNVNYRRAMERELARSIERLDAVSSARVHMVVPPEAIFLDEQRESKASVVVELARGRVLGSGEVAAVGHLVAAAVEGLESDRVSIVDTAGRVLSSGEGGGTVPALTGHQLGLKEQTEAGITAKLVDLIEPVVGHGRVRARADVTLDFTQVQTTEEQFDPASAVVRSEQTSKQKRSSGVSASGAPGTASNLPAGGPAPQSGPQEQSSGKTISYEINRTLRTVQEQGADIARVSVAVLVDNAPDPNGGQDAAGAPATRPRTDEEMQQITKLVQAAMGFDVQRGDVLTVENLPFNTDGPAIAGTPSGGGMSRLIIESTRYLALAVVAFLLFQFLVRPSITAVRTAMGPPPAEPQAMAAGETTAVLVPEQVAELRRRLVQISTEQPEGAARVLSAMMSEDGR